MTDSDGGEGVLITEGITRVPQNGFGLSNTLSLVGNPTSTSLEP